MKKKLSFLSLAIIASLSFASCGTSSISSSSSVSEEPSSIAPVSKLTKKNTTLYVLTDSGVENEENSVYFVEGHGDVPFVGLTEALPIMQRSSNDMTVSTEGKIVTIGREENSGTITFDFDKNTVTYNDMDLFGANHGRQSALNLVSSSSTLESGESKYLKSQADAGLDVYVKGKSITLDMNKYNIPMYFEDGQGYIPVQTLADIVFSIRNIVLAYNGISLYMSGAGFNDEMTASFYQAPKGLRSTELAHFTRDELVLALDIQYGLKEEHGITDFDTFLKQSGLNDDLLSTDPAVSDKALSELIYKYFSDIHGSFISASAYDGADARKKIVTSSSYSPTSSEYYLIRNTYFAARKYVYNTLTAGQATVKDKPDSYEEYGDTAYVTFDQFTVPADGTDYYTTPATADASDTYGIIEYAHSQIFRTNSPVKNVVLDLSCNAGGAINAGVYVAGWFLPYAILNITNSFTGSRGSFTYRSDVNMDGKYDTNDLLSSKKLYLLVSPASFSCANFLASVLKESDQVRLIGRPTGGGACAVEHLTLADGTMFQTSGNKKLSFCHNGSYYSVDRGVDVDFSIANLADFFYRPALTTTIDNLF
jgi:hypothetical protein